jgi:hypothetical protein
MERLDHCFLNFLHPLIRHPRQTCLCWESKSNTLPKSSLDSLLLSIRNLYKTHGICDWGLVQQGNRTSSTRKEDTFVNFVIIFIYVPNRNTVVLSVRLVTVYQAFTLYKKLTFKTKTEPTGLSSFLLSHTTPVLSSHLSNKTVGRLKQTIGDNKSYCSVPAVTQEEHEKTNNEM